MAITIHDHSFQWHKIGGEVVIFEASNQDLTDTTFHYFGYISSFGSWVIQRFKFIGDTVIYAYAAGQSRSDYDALWTPATGRFTDSDPSLAFVTFDQLGADL